MEFFPRRHLNQGRFLGQVLRYNKAVIKKRRDSKCTDMQQKKDIWEM